MVVLLFTYDIVGVATTICQPNEFIIPDSAVVGDVLVLTKPLGTQVSFHFKARKKIFHSSHR